MHGESGVRAAKAKTALAGNLKDQGEYEKASELLTEALGIYQSELSEEVRGAGCFAGAWVWGIDEGEGPGFFGVVDVDCFSGLSVQCWCGEDVGVGATLATFPR